MPLASRTRDQVAGVSDERPEAGLALPAVKILGEGRALDGQRDLEAQRLERACDLDPHLDGRAHDQETAHLGLDGERDDQDGVAAVEPQVASSLLWQLGVRDPVGGRVVAQPVECRSPTGSRCPRRTSRRP